MAPSRQLFKDPEMIEEPTGDTLPTTDDAGTPDASAAPGAFEGLYAELEETVRRLEGGDLSLSDALSLFERSTALAEKCNALLDRAELRVQQLIQRRDGSLDTQPFEN
jgi:exodeoxyribonuclease VII small subunit